MSVQNTYLARYLGVIVLYTVGMYVLSYLLIGILQLTDSSNIRSGALFFGNGIVFPFLLGVIAQRVLSTSDVFRLWPVVFAPFGFLFLRLVLDDVSSYWLRETTIELILLAGFSGLVALFGTWVASRFPSR